MSGSTNRTLVILAVLGCFTLAFGGAYALEEGLIWLLQSRFRMAT
jgi:hypothetical protein